MPEEPFKDGGKDTKGGIDVFTVDEDRHNTGKGLLQFVKYSPDAGGLTGSRRPAKVGIDGSCSLQGRAQGSCELAELNVTIVDGFGCIIEFKDFVVTDECLVVHEIVMRHDEGSEVRVDSGWAGGV